MAVNLIKLKHAETGTVYEVPEHMVANAEGVGFERVDSIPDEAPKEEDQEEAPGPQDEEETHFTF